jgi:Domain of unknown function (DUF6265)
LKRIGFRGLRAAVAATLLCAFMPAGPIGAQQATGNGADPGVKTPAQHLTIDQFSWLEGQWRGEWGSRVAEQRWLEPKAGEMAGLFRLIEGPKTLVLELFSIVEKPEEIQFYLRHLTPELLPWEKSDATELKLESVDATKAIFVNPINGEPKRLIFTRVDADTYTQRSEIEPAEGEPQVIEITFHRQKPPAAAVNAGSAGHRKKP